MDIVIHFHAVQATAQASSSSNSKNEVISTRQADIEIDRSVLHEDQ